MQNDRIKYDILADDNKINYTNNTKKLIGNRALIVVLAFLCALVMDIVVIAIIAVKESIGSQYAIPIILLIVDSAFLVVSCFCNARANYYKYISIAFVATTIFLSIVAALSFSVSNSISNSIIMTKMAAVLYIVSHVAVALILLALLMVTKRRLTLKTLVAMAVIVVLSLGTVGALSYYYVDSGVWGQDSERTVVYELSKDGNSYMAKGLLDGNSSQVVIPDTFDGKPVKSIDIHVLTDASVGTLVIQGDQPKEIIKDFGGNFVTTVNLANIKNIQVDKNLVNNYRREFYQMAKGVSGIYSLQHKGFERLINAVEPYNLESNERYLSFNYDWSSLDTGMSTIPPIEDNQIVKAGSSAQPTSKWFSNQLEYNNTRAGLISAYYDNNRVVMKDAKDIKSILKGAVIVDTVVKVTFEKVYRVTVNSNDYLYKGDDHYNIPDDRGASATYFASSDSANIYNKLSERAGLSVDNICNSRQISDADGFASVLYSSDGNINIKRNWRVNAPIINSITPSKADFSYTYGEQVYFDIDASRPDGIEYYYTLQYASGSTLVTKTNEEGGVAIDRMLPSQSGAFNLIVYAKAINSSLLASEAKSNSFNISIARKALNVEWAIPANMVYNGKDQPIAVTISQDQAVYGDRIDYNVFNANMLNAGKYTASVELINDSYDKYFVTSSNITKTYTIAKYDTSVEWTNTTVVYNGMYQSPEYSAKDVYGQNLELTATENAINAGTYPMLATCVYTNDINNYNLLDNSCDYIIAPKVVTTTFDENIRIVYSGYEQYPQVVSASGFLGNDTISNSIGYVGKYTDVGTYAVTAISTNKNYYIDTNNSNSHCVYTIEKREISPIFDAAFFTYNGLIQSPRVVSLKGLATADSFSNIVGTLITMGENTNVGSYTYTVELPENSNYKFSTSSIGTSYHINKANLTISAKSASKTYDGKAVRNFEYSVNGLVSTDKIADIGAITFDGNAVEAINASNTPYDIVISCDKRGAKVGNYNVTITNGTLTINKAKLSISAKNVSKIYDGKAMSNFEYVVSGLASTDKIEEVGTITVSGKAVGAINASSIPYSIIVNYNGSGSKASNYNVTTANGTLTINKANLTISAKNVSKIYDGNAISNFDYDISGLIDTENITDIGNILFKGNAINAVNASATPYTIAISCDGSGNKASNYNIITQNGELQINKANADIVWSATSFTYNNTPQAPTVIKQGTEYAGEEMNITYSYYDSLGKAIAKPSAVGEYTVKITCTSQNYNYSNLEASFVIKAAEVNQ